MLETQFNLTCLKTTPGNMLPTTNFVSFMCQEIGASNSGTDFGEPGAT